MKFKVKEMGIATGGPLIANINKEDAKELDLHSGDRIKIMTNRKRIVAIINIAQGKAVPRGVVGLFDELLGKLNSRNGSSIVVSLDERPQSLQYIKKKMAGETLTKEEINRIVSDIVGNRLSDIELSYFVAACHFHSMTPAETTSLTKAMIQTGDVLKLRNKIVADKHCTGGVAGNRTTMIVVPIIAAAGITMPKTSSRSITSPAGTADTMEVLCSVSFSLTKMRSIVHKTGACMVWGGAINLAPADDRIIRVEHPLSLDSRSQLIASIMAKKASVSATHLLVDIPVDPFGKVSTRSMARSIKRDFEIMAKKLGMKAIVIITDGSHPIGRGLGPQLEARDVIWVLENDPRAPPDLRQKSIKVAACILELTKKARKGQGKKLASDLLDSGAAWKKMLEIIKAQGGKTPHTDRIHQARYALMVHANRSGKINKVANSFFSKISRIAGSPHDPGAGVYFEKQINSRVEKGDVLYHVYANNKTRLEHVKEILKSTNGVSVR
ncbi:MAG: AMP phosphorylase [Nanoarchaeota archaeon]